MIRKIKTYLKVLFHHHREITSISSGILEFSNKPESQRAQLRRNIHRIEKGLIMRPLKNVFAESYIDETIELYNIVSKSNISNDESAWFDDVLTQYFNLVDKTEIIQLAYSKFDRKTVIIEGPQCIPYPVSQRLMSTITFDDFSTLVKQRRSVRFFKKDKPQMLDIQECINISSQAPSACNRQPFRVIYTDKTDLTKKIASCAGGTSGYADNIPSIMTIVGNLEYFNNPFDRHVPYIDSSLFVMQLLLSLEIKNLSTCVINWPDYKAADEDIRKIIDIKQTERVMMLIAVGCAEQESHIPFSHKKNYTDLLKVL